MGVRATADGGCIIAAGTGDEYSYSECSGGVCSDQWEAYIVKFGPDGDVQWQETYGSNSGNDWAAEDIDLTTDGGAIVAVDNSQFGFLKLAPFNPTPLQRRISTETASCLPIWPSCFLSGARRVAVVQKTSMGTDPSDFRTCRWCCPTGIEAKPFPLLNGHPRVWRA